MKLKVTTVLLIVIALLFIPGIYLANPERIEIVDFYSDYKTSDLTLRAGEELGEVKIIFSVLDTETLEAKDSRLMIIEKMAAHENITKVILWGL